MEAMAVRAIHIWVLHINSSSFLLQFFSSIPSNPFSITFWRKFQSTDSSEWDEVHLQRSTTMGVEMPSPAFTRFVIVFLSSGIPVTSVCEPRTRWIMQLLAPDLTRAGSIGRACYGGFRLEGKRFSTLSSFLRYSHLFPGLCCCRARLVWCLALAVRRGGGLWSVLSLGARWSFFQGGFRGAWWKAMGSTRCGRRTALAFVHRGLL